MCELLKTGVTKMEIDGLACEMNMPPALKSKMIDGKEHAWSLPPYNRLNAFQVDQYPACPTHWMNGSTKASSYFMGVKENRGMWLDFNACSNDPKDVAILVSIQGINPITGIKQDKMRLEQYKHKCPVHDCDFK